MAEAFPNPNGDDLVVVTDKPRLRAASTVARDGSQNNSDSSSSVSPRDNSPIGSIMTELRELNNQVKKYGPVPAGKYRKSMEKWNKYSSWKAPDFSH
jgi:hypothetical protein